MISYVPIVANHEASRIRGPRFELTSGEKVGKALLARNHRNQLRIAELSRWFRSSIISACILTGRRVEYLNRRVNSQRSALRACYIGLASAEDEAVRNSCNCQLNGENALYQLACEVADQGCLTGRLRYQAIGSIPVSVFLRWDSGLMRLGHLCCIS
jgi:hypothetical protein